MTVSVDGRLSPPAGEEGKGELIPDNLFLLSGSPVVGEVCRIKFLGCSVLAAASAEASMICLVPNPSPVLGARSRDSFTLPTLNCRWGMLLTRPPGGAWPAPWQPPAPTRLWQLPESSPCQDREGNAFIPTPIPGDELKHKGEATAAQQTDQTPGCSSPLGRTPRGGETGVSRAAKLPAPLPRLGLTSA